ncbi:tyrosine-type recombinase/integrase [Streptosporangium sp. NPDC020072]|uniref:tyrosine-type recombinase/integrase n=1 Tax=Streptosporangium sp. NPDC020072 TaxID=3154788 RepID=UPI0034382770
MLKPPMPLAEAQEAHVVFMRRVRKLSEGTIGSYRTTYNTLIGHLEGLTVPVIPLAPVPLTTDLLDPELIIDYFANYVSEHCNDGTYAIKISHVRNIIKWLMTHEYITWGPNPVDLLGDRKGDYKPARIRLKDAEWMLVLKVATAHHPRDRALLLAARILPRRINEILDLQWGDIDWEERDIRYDNKKARKYGQQMPLDPEAWAVLSAWKQTYEELTGKEVRRTWYVFPAFFAAGYVKKGRKRDYILAPTSRITTPSRLIRDHLMNAGVYQRQMGWHSLRRLTGNAVRAVARASGRADSLELAKEALNHQSTAITSIYMDHDEQYQEYKAWRLKNRIVPDDLAAQIPELAHLVAPPSHPQTSVTQDTAEGLATVVSLMDRRRTAG